MMHEKWTVFPLLKAPDSPCQTLFHVSRFDLGSTFAAHLWLCGRWNWKAETQSSRTSLRRLRLCHLCGDEPSVREQSGCVTAADILFEFATHYSVSSLFGVEQAAAVWAPRGLTQNRTVDFIRRASNFGIYIVFFNIHRPQWRLNMCLFPACVTNKYYD